MSPALAVALLALLAAGRAGASTVEVPQVEPAGTFDLCNMTILDKAAAETDTDKIVEALGKYADKAKKVVRVPTIKSKRGEPGTPGSNPLCEGTIWWLIQEYEPSKSLFKGNDVAAQVKQLQYLNKEWVTLNKAIEVFIAEAVKVVKIGEKIGFAVIKESTYETRTRPGRDGEEAGKGVTNKLYDPKKADPQPTRDTVKLPADQLQGYGVMLVAAEGNDKTKTDEDKILVGSQVVEMEKALAALRAAIKTWTANCAPDLKTGLSDERPGSPLTVAGLRKELINTAKNRLASEPKETPTKGALAVIYENRATWVSSFGEAAIRYAVLPAHKFFVVDAVNPLSPAPGDPQKPKPGAGLEVEKFRNAFETKALQDIAAGAGGLPQGIDREDLKTAKAYQRGDKMVLITDKGLKIGETPIPASLGDGQTSESVGTDAATAVAAKFLKGDTAGAFSLTITETLMPRTPANVPGSAGAAAGASEVQQGAGSAGCGDKRSTADRYAANQTEACGEQGKSNVVERKKLAEEMEQKKKDCDSDPFKKSQAAACKAQVDVDYKPRFEAMDSGKETVARKTCVATADSKVQEYLFTEILNQAQSLQGDYKGGRADSLATEAGIPGKGKYLSGPVDGYFNTKWAGEEGKKSVVACSGKLKPSATAKTTEPSKENVDKLCVHDDLVAAIKASLSAVGSAEAAPLPSGAGDAGGYIEKETKFKPK